MKFEQRLSELLKLSTAKSNQPNDTYIHSAYIIKINHIYSNFMYKALI